MNMTLAALLVVAGALAFYLAAPRQQLLRQPIPGWLGMGAGVALMALLGVAGFGAGGVAAWRLWREHVPGWQAELATATGRQSVQELPDGSTIALDAQALPVFAAACTSPRRTPGCACCRARCR